MIHINIFLVQFLLSAPPNTSAHIDKFLANPIIEIDYYASHKLPTGEEIIALPTVHFSITNLLSLKPIKTSSYLVKSSAGNFYFCGDSGYGPQFKEAGSICKIDLAILPIGGYLPNFLQKWHMDPPHALQAFKDLKAKNLLPIHHSTFRTSFENPFEPKRWIEALMTEKPSLRTKIHNISPGNEIII